MKHGCLDGNCFPFLNDSSHGRSLLNWTTSALSASSGTCLKEVAMIYLLREFQRSKGIIHNSVLPVSSREGAALRVSKF